MLATLVGGVCHFDAKTPSSRSVPLNSERIVGKLDSDDSLKHLSEWRLFRSKNRFLIG